jgi:hypothetical protein
MTPDEERELQRREALRRSGRPKEQENVIFSTDIENSVIANMAEIGVYPFAVYSVIKMHEIAGESSPSYAEISRITGMDRSTVIRSVKKLTGLNLLSSQRRVKEDGSPNSNQYNVQPPKSR